MKNGKKTAGILPIVALGWLMFSACPNNSSDTPAPDNKDPPPIDGYSEPLKLWYTDAALDSKWMHQALPIGNGELGAMFGGGKIRERIQFNEKTLWSGNATNNQGDYQNFGNLYIDVGSHTADDVTEYRRELCISDALGTVSYTAKGVSYKREYFASFPDKVIVVRFTTPGSEDQGLLTLTADLNNARSGSKTADGNTIYFSGTLTTVSYAARLAVLNEGGTLSIDSNKIKVEGANAVTFLLAGATNFDLDSPTFTGLSVADLILSVAKTIEKASAKSYDTLKNAHIADYRSMFYRMTLDLHASDPGMPTDQLMKTNKESVYLDMLYFQYGRYLMLGCSRGEMGVPSNLQGIWNDSNNPPWHSDIHSNINVQMNYWPAEVTNLSECHMPFLNYIAVMSQKPNSRWRALAASKGVRGWTLQTETSLFGYMAATPNNPGNAWYCMHLWQHYLYTLDRAFLIDTAWPAMKSACEFWLDYLIDDNGEWQTPHGYSPEQDPYSPPYDQVGVPYDQQLIWTLFDSTLKAGEIIGGESDFLREVRPKFRNLDPGLHLAKDCAPPQTRSNGNGEDIDNMLAEYRYGNSSQHDPNHRHISHLIGFYPSDQVTRYYPQFIPAVKESLIGRGDHTTGWAMGWRINCWARMLDGNHAYKLLKEALSDASNSADYGADGGVYENLFDAHPPFQIDGNFGATAGIAEMLIQSHMGYIEVLPALPDVWPSGKFTGLKAQGNFTVDLEWSGSRPTRCKVYSGSGGELRIRFKDTEKVEQTSRGGSYTISF